MFITTFCKQNSVRFYPVDQPLAPQYSFVHFDAASFQNTIQSWQMDVAYYQKAMFEDQIVVMVHTQNSGVVPEDYPPQLFLLDHNLNQIASLNSAPQYYGTQTPANDFYTDPVSGDTYQMNCTLWVFNFGSFISPATDSGIYYLQLDNYFPAVPDVNSFLSEPFFVSETQDRTLYFQYSNNSNKNDVVVDNWAGGYYPVFCSRMEADIREYKPFGISIGYLEQDYLQLQQYGQSWRTWLLRLGSNTMGVPAYILERAAEIFNCDNVLIDGKAFIFDSQGGNGNASAAAFWKVNDTDVSPLIRADLPIRERYGAENTITNFSLGIFTVPGSADPATGTRIPTVPFAFMGFQLFNGVAYAACPQFVFRNTADISNFLSYLNTTMAVTFGMTGTFAYNSADGVVSYNNGPGENWSIYAVYDVLTQYLNLPIQVTISGDIWLIGIDTTGGAELIFDWGDMNTFPYDTELDVYPFSGSYAPNKKYLVPGSYSPYVFFNSEIKNLLLIDSLVKITVNAGQNISGSMPSSLNTLVIAHQNFDYASVNIPIAACAATLENISIEGCQVIGFANDLFGTAAFNALSNIAIGDNSLPSSEIDALFNAFEAYTSYVAGGNFDTAGQTPPAPPTISSVLARSFLSFAGWTITTD